jgi:MSHA biogenesis protein MshN
MSLLNDMLQDLQQQPGQDTDISDASNRTQLNESGIIKKTSVPWLASVLVFVGVLGILLLAKYYYRQLPANPSIEITESVVTEPMALTNSASIAAIAKGADVDQSLSAPSLSLPDMQPNTTPSTPTQIQTLTTIEQAQIEELLMLARQAIAHDRLTSPFEDNAYTYYQQILTIEPENPLATQGILQLADRYLAMADKKLEAGNQDAAYRLLQRAQLVAPQYSAVIAFIEQRQTLFEERLSEVQSETSNKLAENILPESSISGVAEQSVHKKTDSVSIQDPFNPSIDKPHLSISPNAQWQDQQQVQDARLLLQQAKPAQAITALESFIANNNEATQSTRLLLDIYCEQARVDDAQRILAFSSDLEKVDQHYYKARLALLNGQAQEAIDLLEAELSIAEKHEQYRALLAGIYQKTAHYPQAATSYKRLLEVFGEKPAYWLGYALALDALEQKANALQAYRRLSEYTNLQTEVRTYIEQRIAALQS